jgi:hypothetical protein
MKDLKFQMKYVFEFDDDKKKEASKNLEPALRLGASRPARTADVLTPSTVRLVLF